MRIALGATNKRAGLGRAMMENKPPEDATRTGLGTLLRKNTRPNRAELQVLPQCRPTAFANSIWQGEGRYKRPNSRPASTPTLPGPGPNRLWDKSRYFSGSGAGCWKALFQAQELFIFRTEMTGLAVFSGGSNGSFGEVSAGRGNIGVPLSSKCARGLLAKKGRISRKLSGLLEAGGAADRGDDLALHETARKEAGCASRRFFASKAKPTALFRCGWPRLSAGTKHFLTRDIESASSPNRKNPSATSRHSRGHLQKLRRSAERGRLDATTPPRLVSTLQARTRALAIRRESLCDWRTPFSDGRLPRATLGNPAVPARCKARPLYAGDCTKEKEKTNDAEVEN